MPRPLPFTAHRLLAPMEGVTDPCFRDLVLARNAPEALGGAFTEFARVVQVALPRRSLREHLGARRFAQPVGLQLMGSDTELVAESARRAEEVGAPLVDLNFGCPAKGALRGCAGSSLLRDPSAVERLVRAAVGAVERVPVSAKIRAGYDDDSRLEELARAAENGGASLLTVHCRTKAELYCDEVDWTRLARAASAVSIPVCGNGGVRTHTDFERLRRETGCAYAMVGRAALGDPWIFSGARVTAADAARFLLDYAEVLRAEHVSARGAAGRVKQLLQHWTAGGLCDEDRASWLTESEPERLFARLGAVAGGTRDPVLNPAFEAELDTRPAPEPRSTLGARLVPVLDPPSPHGAPEARALGSTSPTSIAALAHFRRPNSEGSPADVRSSPDRP
ncbi:MAG: tRNA-dihydrouridine synthase family protein [Planctomycetes bacterium]|nr:tRNA-dihydrouridine synthase family protein [Planctomycetota bacterium]